MAKKIYLVFNVVGNHEYTITKKNSAKGEVTTLFRSLSSDWTEAVRGEKVLKMIDSGNGVTFDREMQSLDYSELAERLDHGNQCDYHGHQSVDQGCELLWCRA
jgi:hypothetical protein